MTRSTDRREPPPQRFSGPWSPNPWRNPLNFGPRNHQVAQRKPLSIQALSASLSLPERAAPMSEPDTVKLREKEGKQRRRALSTWEDEGGQNG